MIRLQLFVADPGDLSSVSQTALARARAAAARFPGEVEVETLALGSDEAIRRGLSLEPAVLVGELLIAVGQAPPAGHLVRALQAALDKERSADV